jgi:Ca-activated chloride channel family protein
MCQNAFVKEERKQKVIVLISDGEGHDEKTTDWISMLNESGIVVHAVGVGTANGAPIPENTSGTYKKDAEGKTILTRLNPKSLQEIAKGTNGRYIELKKTDQAVEQIAKQVSRMEKNATVDPSLADNIEYFQWFIAPALLSTLAGFFWPERKKSIRP